MENYTLERSILKWVLSPPPKVLHLGDQGVAVRILRSTSVQNALVIPAPLTTSPPQRPPGESRLRSHVTPLN